MCSADDDGSAIGSSAVIAWQTYSPCSAGTGTGAGAGSGSGWKYIDGRFRAGTGGAVGDGSDVGRYFWRLEFVGDAFCCWWCAVLSFLLIALLAAAAAVAAPGRSNPNPPDWNDGSGGRVGVPPGVRAWILDGGARSVRSRFDGSVLDLVCISVIVVVVVVVVLELLAGGSGNADANRVFGCCALGTYNI